VAISLIRVKIDERLLPNNTITIISGAGKATDFKFGWYIHRIDRNRSPKKFPEKYPWAYSGTLENFQGTHIGPVGVHRAVISAIAQLSCVY